MINVFDYMDYREFLRDFYKEQKKSKPFFSYRYIGIQVEMDSSYIIKVLQGTLHISPRKIDSFVKLMKLNENEAEYFDTLVHFGRAKTEHERKLCFDKLFSISTVKARCIEVMRYEFFQKWYYPAIWSLINCTPFKGDFQKLAEKCRPRISVTEARQAIKLLSTLGFIRKDSSGVYHTTELNLTTGEKWYSFVIENYQREMMRLAGESLQLSGKQERDISTVTLCIDEKMMPEIREHIRQFRSSLVKMVNSSGGTERVFQLNVQLFPLSNAGEDV